MVSGKTEMEEGPQGARSSTDVLSSILSDRVVDGQPLMHDKNCVILVINSFLKTSKLGVESCSGGALGYLRHPALQLIYTGAVEASKTPRKNGN